MSFAKMRSLGALLLLGAMGSVHAAADANAICKQHESDSRCVAVVAEVSVLCKLPYCVFVCICDDALGS